MRTSHVGFRAFLVAVIAAGAFLTPVSGKTPSPAPMNQSAAPDAYGYKWIDNQGSDSPAAGGAGPDYTALYQDISTSGTQLSLNFDDGTTTFTCPILIRYYGSNWGTPPGGSGITSISPNLVVSSNNNVQFLNSGQSGNASYSNTQLPVSAMNGMVAPFWDDGYGAGATNTARWEVLGTAPNRRLLIQWTNWDFCCSDGINMTFQVQFTESDGTGDSQITFLYPTISSSDQRQQGNSATIGIQAPNVSAYSQYSLNTASVVQGRAIRFSNNAPPSAPASLVQTGDPSGGSRPLGFISDSTVYFRATVSDPDSGSSLGIQAEVLPSSQPFTTGVTGPLVTTATTDFVGEGATAEVLFDFDDTSFGSGDYHWRARTIDSAGATSAWVLFNPATIHFTTDFDPPSTVSGPFSPNGVQLIFTSPTSDVDFSWGTAVDVGPPGPIAYRMEVATSDTFSTIIYSATVSTQSITAHLSAASEPYYWHVSAVDQAGNVGPPSATSVFQQGWTTTAGEGEDKYANCGAGPGAGAPISALLGGLIFLAAIFQGRRRAAGS